MTFSSSFFSARRPVSAMAHLFPAPAALFTAWARAPLRAVFPWLGLAKLKALRRSRSPATPAHSRAQPQAALAQALFPTADQPGPPVRLFFLSLVTGSDTISVDAVVSDPATPRCRASQVIPRPLNSGCTPPLSPISSGVRFSSPSSRSRFSLERRRRSPLPARAGSPLLPLVLGARVR